MWQQHTPLIGLCHGSFQFVMFVRLYCDLNRIQLYLNHDHYNWLSPEQKLQLTPFVHGDPLSA